jgi:7-keto-8-aminopelargonate synthetase-like enzyme
MLSDLAGEDGAAYIAQLRTKAAALHEALQTAVSASAARVHLTGSRDSYVKHLRWAGAPESGEEELLAVAAKCQASGIRVQVCRPGMYHAEGAFGARIGAPTAGVPSLRFCASARISHDDIQRIGEVICAALKVQ